MKNIRERVTKNGVKSYQVNFKYRDSYGVQRRYVKSFSNLSKAKKHLAEMQVKLDAGFQIEQDKKMTFKEVMEEFLVNDRSYSHNTMYNTKKYLDIITDAFGSAEIAKIDYVLIQKYFNERSQYGLETNKNIKKAINRVFLYAIKAGYIKENPTKYVTVTGVPNKRKNKGDIEVITREQFDMIVEHLVESNYNQSYTVALYLMYMLGLRPSECVCLEFDDINFEESTIFIHKKLNYKGLKEADREVSDKLKTSASYSELPMPDELREVLMKWKKHNPYSYIVVNSNGHPVSPDVLGNMIRKIVKKIGGLNGFSLYTLRHSYITNLSMAGIDPKTFQDLCRHSSIATSFKYYVHSSDERKREAISKVYQKTSE